MKFLVALIFLLTSMSNFVFAGDEIPLTIKLNNEIIDVEKTPIVEDGHILIPFRTVLEKLGVDILWNASNRTILCSKDETEILVTIDEPYIEVNGEKKSIDVPTKIINGITFMPIRAILENFGAVVNWNSLTRTIEIELENTIDFDYKEELLTSENGVYNVFDDDGILLISSEVQSPENSLEKIKKSRVLGANYNRNIPEEYWKQIYENVNSIMKNNFISAESFLNKFIREQGYKNINELKKEAEMSKKEKSDFKPFELKLNYEVNIFEDFVSIKSVYDANCDDKRFNKIVSNTYSIETGKEVTLKNISKNLFGGDEDYIIDAVKEVFRKKINENPSLFFENANELVNDINANNFYFSLYGLNFFFNEGEISDELQEVFIYCPHQYNYADGI